MSVEFALNRRDVKLNMSDVNKRRTGTTSGLKYFSPTEQNSTLVLPIHIQIFVSLEELDGFFQQRCRFPGKHCFVYYTGS